VSRSQPPAARESGDVQQTRDQQIRDQQIRDRQTRDQNFAIKTSRSKLRDQNFAIKEPVIRETESSECGGA
jgi:hypothetical protein